MKFATRSLTIALVLMSLYSAAQAQNDMRYFITRSGDKLMEGDREYRFISFNIPNLHLVEDNMPFEATNEWRFPNDFEIADALSSVKQMGGRAVRIFVLSICKKDGPNPIPCHVKKPGEFNEEAFRALDKVLQIANQTGVRVTMPFGDYWKWWGGIEDYANYRGKPAEAFWTDPEIIEDYKRTINFLLTRRNTYTGTLYKDDKTILAWETGNELECPYSWTKQIAAYVKSLDPNHLVIDGRYIGHMDIVPESLTDPNIDIISSHHYPEGKGAKEMAEDIGKFHRQTDGKKAYIIGELGFIPLSGIEHVLDAVIRNGISGAMIWSLRFHDRDGGFYWHSEPAVGGAFKAYHYPGFATGESYEEAGLLRLMRAKAAEISGVPAQAAEAPATPTLLPAKSATAIAWQGSVGASGYDVERATQPIGPWTIVGMNLDDSRVQYRPLFSDDYAETGNVYYYRVRARNSAGSSAASNVIGPIRVEETAVIDELSDMSRIFASGGKVSIETSNARAYKEDASRLKGSADGWIMYRSLLPMRSAKVFAFMESAQKNFDFYVSADGIKFVKAEPKTTTFPTTVNLYGYKLPVQYELAGLAPDSRFLKLVFKTEAQISRVELRHSKPTHR